MRKTLTAALAALTLGGAISATVATGADARPYGYGGYGYGYHGGYRHGGGNGAAIVAGVAGLAIGAALASDHPRYYGGPAYYYGPPAPYYYGPATCYATRWIWDPYVGHQVPQRYAYAC